MRSGPARRRGAGSRRPDLLGLSAEGERGEAEASVTGETFEIKFEPTIEE